MDRLLAGDGRLQEDITVEIAVPCGTLLPFALERIAVRVVGGGGGHRWEQVALARAARGGLLSLANTGPVLHRTQIVCVHDTNTRTCPDSYSRAFRLFYRGLHPLLGRTATAIATVSQFSAAEIARLRIADRAKIFVAPNGYEHALLWTAQHTPATRAASGPGTIIVLGSPAPHKNISMLVNLAPQLAVHGLSLAIAGVRDGQVFANSAGARGASGHANVHWLGRVSDDALAALMSECLCRVSVVHRGFWVAAVGGDGARLSGCCQRPGKLAGNLWWGCALCGT
jgi:glycosyltransferase involved in cell wall biosynthesis